MFSIYGIKWLCEIGFTCPLVGQYYLDNKDDYEWILDYLNKIIKEEVSIAIEYQ